MMGELSYKSDRVGQKDLTARGQLVFSCCRVKCGKQLVFGKYARIGQAIEKRGFACVGISHDGNLGDAAFVA